ncbi:CBS domain-containing protein [Streptomyces flavofungini]|uniref:CBS domain-containing protein n=2 Tax=Streptomyces flavofungini TaxID=68200 RepID=A0ABS0XEV7_9ACTN|nr:CBS domain-containing protein [Streptomyces flavofungini]
MTTVPEIMAGGAQRIGAHETVLAAARKPIRDLQVGALSMCGDDNRPIGVITDRDIVVKVLGTGLDPSEGGEVGTLAQGEAVTIGADDDADEIFATLTLHKVRCLPVIDPVGMVALADAARARKDPEAGRLIEALATD